MEGPSNNVERGDALTRRFQLSWTHRATRPTNSRRNPENGLARNPKKWPFAKKCLLLDCCWVRVTGLYVLFQHFVGKVWFWYAFTVFQNARYPNNYQHVSNILLGSGYGFVMLKFPPTLFFHFLDPRGGSPGRKMAFSRELGMAGLKSQVLS